MRYFSADFYEDQLVAICDGSDMVDMLEYNGFIGEMYIYDARKKSIKKYSCRSYRKFYIVRPSFFYAHVYFPLKKTEGLLHFIEAHFGLVCYEFPLKGMSDKMLISMGMIGNTPLGAMSILADSDGFDIIFRVGVS